MAKLRSAGQDVTLISNEEYAHAAAGGGSSSGGRELPRRARRRSTLWGLDLPECNGAHCRQTAGQRAALGSAACRWCRRSAPRRIRPGHTPRLWIVTAGAQAAGGSRHAARRTGHVVGARPRPSRSSIRSSMRPRASISTRDSMRPTKAAALLERLTATDDEAEIALRAGRGVRAAACTRLA